MKNIVRKKSILVVCVILSYLLLGCNMNNEEHILENKEQETVNVESTELICDLYCLASSETEAKDIADKYQITLIAFQSGVAQFSNTSGKTYGEIIKIGQNNNWPVLSRNRTVSIGNN